MTAIVIIQDEKERELLKKHFNGLEFDYTVINSPSSVVKVEGLKFTQVWYTPDVMINGMDEDLFNTLYRTLLCFNTMPSKGFRLVT